MWWDYWGWWKTSFWCCLPLWRTGNHYKAQHPTSCLSDCYSNRTGLCLLKITSVNVFWCSCSCVLARESPQSSTRMVSFLPLPVQLEVGIISKTCFIILADVWILASSSQKQHFKWIQQLYTLFFCFMICRNAWDVALHTWLPLKVYGVNEQYIPGHTLLTVCQSKEGSQNKRGATS